MAVLNNNRALRLCFLLLACIASIVVLFHNLFFSNFNILLGDRFDALIETNLLQHWYNVIQGKSKWDTVGYFYPFTNTLGYNDGYFLYGVFYSIFRLLGFDLFISTDLVNISLKIIGFFSFYFLAKKVFKFSFWVSLIGATAFTLGNLMAVHMRHAQLLSIAFAPLLTIFVLRYFQSLKFNDSKKTLINGCFASLLLSLWLFTSYYMAWYFILFFVVCSFIFMFFCVSNKEYRNNLKIKVSLKVLIVPIVVLMFFLMPFLKVYLPKASETGGQSLYAVEYYAPVPYNVIDPGEYNLIFGKLTNAFFSNIDNLNRVGEFSIGLAPISLLILLITLACLSFKKIKSTFEIFIFSVCLTTVVTALFAIKFGDIFLWKFIWQYFPGAKGMRVTGRYFLFLIFPVVLVSTWFLDKIASKRGWVLFSALSILLILEQVNFAHNAAFNREDNKRFINSVPVPPKGCKAFYVVGQRKGEFPIVTDNITISYYPHNVDAMLISEVDNLRTINGFSTFNPPGWDFALNPLQSYMARVQNYINNNNIANGMCEFDLENLKWTEFKPHQPLGITSKIFDKVDIKASGIVINQAVRKNYGITVMLTNNSDFNLGEGSYRPLKVGIKLYNSDGKLKNHDYMHLDVPQLSVGKKEVSMDIKLPDDFKPDDYISVSLLEEGVAWFDWLGAKPVVVKF